MKGGCHCGKVQFEVKAPEKVVICNCSICTKKGFLHHIVKKEDFKLLTEWDNLENYQFNTKTASHLFCKSCGICSFYIPRSHPDGYSVNARCLEGFDIEKVGVSDFDGQNWEKSRHTL